MADRTEAQGIEAELTAYYDSEAADRAGRALDPDRLAARSAFLDRLREESIAGPVLEVGAVITDGNTPSEALFRSLGFERHGSW